MESLRERILGADDRPRSEIVVEEWGVGPGELYTMAFDTPTQIIVEEKVTAAGAASRSIDEGTVVLILTEGLVTAMVPRSSIKTTLQDCSGRVRGRFRRGARDSCAGRHRSTPEERRRRRDRTGNTAPSTGGGGRRKKLRRLPLLRLAFRMVAGGGWKNLDPFDLLETMDPRLYVYWIAYYLTEGDAGKVEAGEELGPGQEMSPASFRDWAMKRRDGEAQS